MRATLVPGKMTIHEVMTYFGDRYRQIRNGKLVYMLIEDIDGTVWKPEFDFGGKLIGYTAQTEER